MRQPSNAQSGRTTNGPPDADNRRQIERVPTQFSLMYSGMYDGRMLIGNGMVCNVSPNGIGIQGNHLVKLGMNLSLFIDLPGIDEPVCVAETRVSWVSGCRFGVEVIAAKPGAQNELRLYVWNHLHRPPHRKSQQEGEP